MSKDLDVEDRDKQERLRTLKAREADRRAFQVFGQPLPALPIPGHQCSVPGCVGYVRTGKHCADHVQRSVG